MSEPPRSPEEEELQRELLQHYLKTADAKVDNIGDAIARVRAQSGPERTARNPDPRRALVGLLHTLAGNAGTYGFKEISERALDLERALIAGADSSEPGDLLLADLDRFRDELSAAFAAARSLAR